MPPPEMLGQLPAFGFSSRAELWGLPSLVLVGPGRPFLAQVFAVSHSKSAAVMTVLDLG